MEQQNGLIKLEEVIFNEEDEEKKDEFYPSLEDDEIDSREAGFMMGYEEAISDEKEQVEEDEQEI